MEKEKKKKIITAILIFLFFTAFATFLALANKGLNYDIIWCFHMSQKVANGYQMYSEISTVVMPIYFWLGGLFIKIFGNAITSMEIYGGIVWGIISMTSYLIIDEISEKKNKLLTPCFILFLITNTLVLSSTNYNSLALMWVLVALLLEIKRKKTKKQKYNYLVGIFLALAFFTKQNIGTYGVIATGLISIIDWIFISKENKFKEILQKASGFLCTLLLFVGYFFIIGTFNEFINFCIGGIFEFGSENVSLIFTFNFLPIIAVIEVAILSLKYVKKENCFVLITLTYMCGMLFVMYPLLNEYHFVLGSFTMFFVIAATLEHLKEKENIYNFALLLYVFWWCVAPSIWGGTEYTETEMVFGARAYTELFCQMLYASMIIMFMILSFYIATKNEKIHKIVFLIGLEVILLTSVAEYFLFTKNIPTQEGLEIYANHGYDEVCQDYISNVINYIKEKEDEGYNVYVVSADASYYMAPLNRNQYKYDLTLYGSLGYKGEEKLIEETAMLENVILLKDKNLMWQEPIKFDEFIKENYEAIDEIEYLIVYKEKE